MTTQRHAELREALLYVRAARAALSRGDLPSAFRYHRRASEGLAFTKGLFSQFASVTATATLWKIVRRLGGAIEAAVQPVERVEAGELVPAIAAGIRILATRDGVDIEDRQVSERANCIAQNLVADFQFTAVQ